MRAKLQTVSAATTNEATTNDGPRRIGPREAHRLVREDDALLICAYADDEKCERIALEGSISYPAFTEKLSDLSSDRALIFY